MATGIEIRSPPSGNGDSWTISAVVDRTRIPVDSAMIEHATTPTSPAYRIEQDPGTGPGSTIPVPGTLGRDILASPPELAGGEIEEYSKY